MDRSENMRRIRSKDTKPELLVRSLIHRLGYRFRLHRHDVPGTPDMVFPARMKVIFVHGCFWHGHARCKVAHIPKSNRAYWRPKLKRTQMRDAMRSRELRKLGWQSLVLWECQLLNLERVAARVKRFLDS